MDLREHPCFNSEKRHTTARIHLPVAPSCNMQCNFCNRKYDCVNESRPGVASGILSPFHALAYLDSVMERLQGKPPVSVIGIAGPGDPLANPEQTLATLELVHKQYPDMLLCLATNGLRLPEYADDLVGLGVSHVTVTMNAVDPTIGAKIYSWIRYEPKVYRGSEGAALLLEKQTQGIKKLKAAGSIVKINTVVIPGINTDHAVQVAKYCAALGVDVQNCIPMMHVEDTLFEDISGPSNAVMRDIREEASVYLHQMSHCARCRADAVGLLGEETLPFVQTLLLDAAIPKPLAQKNRLAVTSLEGLFVNQHLGEASQLWIFGSEDGQVRLLEMRTTPTAGTGNRRWEALADLCEDCFCLLTADCGQAPKRVLAQKGISIVAAEGLISDTADALFSGKGVPRIHMPRCAKGSGCSGSGMGCGA